MPGHVGVSSGLMPTTIFWPVDVKHSGFCYGWTTPAVCVTGVLKAFSEQDADATLHSLCQSQQWKNVAASCGSEPVIIGKCEFQDEVAAKQLCIPHLTLRTPLDYQIIYYTRHKPRTLRFYSLEILKLDTSNRVNVPDGSAFLPSLQHDFTIPKHKKDTSSINDTVVNQFNAARTLDDFLQPQNTQDKSLAAYLLNFNSLSDLSWAFATISQTLTAFCNVSLLASFPGPVLKDISATVQQMDIRAEQIDFFANEVGCLSERSSTAVEQYSARYTNFFNVVWLILNDLTMGIAIGTFICENHLALSHMLSRTVEDSFIIWVQWALQWLNSWPAGLKLNTELSGFYFHSFNTLVATWRGFLSKGEPYLPTIMYLMGILSCGGISFAISIALDALAFSTFHIFICYAISGAVYQRMLKTFGSLWNLFRGKRYNVLRNRTDSWDYDLDQLLFGTILFTLLAFLFPTVLVYYALFAVLRFGVLAMQAGLETILAFINHFPLFALMLRVKDPWRLPGGIYFVRRTIPGSTYCPLEIKNQPVPLSSIFFQYIRLLSKLAAHYNPFRLLWCVLSGNYLAAIPRYSIRYNKMPNHRHA